MFLKDDYIGQYQVIKVLASTPSSEVYLVHCASLNTQLVLKVASAESLFTSELNKNQKIDAQTHFLQQAKLMHAFSGQPHIVNLMHIGVHKYTTETETSQSIHYMVMPYFPQTLADVLALHQQKLNLAQTVECIEHLLIALKSLHQQGVLHLDIKPQNVFLDSTSQYYLGDFDNAQILSSSPLIKKLNVRLNTQSATTHTETKTQTKITTKYASPEQRSGVRNLSHSADLYSIGILAYRLICGQTPNQIMPEELAAFQPDVCSYLDKIAQALASHKTPAWLTELIVSLLQYMPDNRPDSAQAILQIIQNYKQTPEDEATLYLGADEVYSASSKALKEEITQILLTHGLVSQDEQKRLAHSSFLDTEQSEAAKLAITALLIEEVKQDLIHSKNLANWFGWINYVQVLKQQETHQLSAIDYKQTLEVGRASRADNPKLADDIMQANFSYKPFGGATLKRFILPIAAIGLVLLYWLSNINQPTLRGENESVAAVGSPSNVDALNNNAVNSSDTALSKLKESVWANQQNKEQNAQQVSEEMKLRVEDLSDETALLAQKKLVKNSSKTNTLSQPSVNKQTEAYWRYTLNADEVFGSQKSQSVAFDMVKINTEFAVMRTEVTQGLYQLCIDEGACRKRKIFTTAKPSNSIDLAQLPMVNVSWFEVKEEFIPWLKHKTKLNFSLPRMAQWMMYAGAKNNRNKIQKISHCKDCKNTWSKQIKGSTIAVTALPASSLGLYGIWGNAQEWLADCVIQNQIERCDQAIVIGGSWIDNYQKIQSKNASALLKRASTPTTGFRLIEILNE